MEKKIFITGASTGFGKLTALTLSNAGHTVIAGMRGVAGKNSAVADELGSIPNIEVIDIDVTGDDSVEKAFASILKRHGHIDVLVNNAGVTGFGLLEAYSLEHIRILFEVNFYGVIRTYQAVLPSMRKMKKGLIINLTSGASGHTMPFMIPYLASKFGVESITEGLQEELKEFNIENVSIQPGVYPTEMTDGTKPGINADKADIITAYGEGASKQFNAIGVALFGKMALFNMDPQTIADGILKLVEMKDGTRPLRYPLDAVAQGTDQEFIDSRAAIKAKWDRKVYGIVNHY